MKNIGSGPANASSNSAGPARPILGPGLAPDSGPPLDPPLKAPAGSGFTWLSEGWALFREAPGTWVALILVWILLSTVLAVVPMATNLLAPVFAGGLMLGCHGLAGGGPLNLEHLFAGFRRNLGSLLMIGLLALAGTFVAVGLLAAIATATALAASVSPDDLLARGIEAVDSPGVLAFGLLLGLLVFLTLSLGVAMASWFAPALAVLHGLPAVPAMVLSFRGCLANLAPLLVYGLYGLVLAIAATIPFGLGWLVLAPVLVASTYAAYREIFTRPG
jgi:uncharacterized membrane protein